MPPTLLGLKAIFFGFIFHHGEQFREQLVRMGSSDYSLLCVLWKIIVMSVQNNKLFIMFILMHSHLQPNRRRALFFCTVPAAVVCASIKRKQQERTISPS